MDKLDGLLKEFEALQDENKILRQKLSELGEEVAEKREVEKPPLSPLPEKEDRDGGESVKKYEADFYNDVMIPDNYGISVMSLTEGVLILSTEKKGEGHIYRWAAGSFGEKKPIPYVDLVDIMRYQKHFFDKGVFAILNEDFLRKFSLKNQAVPAGTMARMVQGGVSEEDFIKFYKAMPVYQREELIRQMVRRLAADENSYSAYLIKKVFNELEIDLESLADRTRGSLNYLEKLGKVFSKKGEMYHG